MVKEIIGISTEHEIKTIRGTRWRYTYRVKQIRVKTNRWSYAVRPSFKKGIFRTRLGQPYKVVAHKGARFVKFSDATVEEIYPYLEKTTYIDYKREFISRERVEEPKDKMFRYVVTIRNKSRGKAKMIRNVEASLEVYYPIDEDLRDEAYKRMVTSIDKTDFSWILHNFEVEGEETKEVPYDEKLLYTYHVVIRDKDYRVTRHKDSGKLV